MTPVQRLHSRRPADSMKRRLVRGRCDTLDALPHLMHKPTRCLLFLLLPLRLSRLQVVA